MMATPWSERFCTTQIRAIIDERRIVEPLPITEQTADDGADIKKVMPLTAHSGQAR